MPRYDHQKAAEYLSQALKVGVTTEAFVMALREQVILKGGVRKCARATGLNPEGLYKMLSGERDSRLSTFMPILKWLGVEFGVQVRVAPRAAAESVERQEGV